MILRHKGGHNAAMLITGKDDGSIGMVPACNRNAGKLRAGFT